jgi:hypothetical protein
MKEIMNKYPSSQSQVIKECFFDRSKVLNELQIAYFEDPGTISLDVAYASDALDACEHSLSNEKFVDISSISILNDVIHLVVGNGIAAASSFHIKI